MEEKTWKISNGEERIDAIGKPITIQEAIKIAREILEKAEEERIEYADSLKGEDENVSTTRS